MEFTKVVFIASACFLLMIYFGGPWMMASFETDGSAYSTVPLKTEQVKESCSNSNTVTSLGNWESDFWRLFGTSAVDMTPNDIKV